MKLDLLRDLLNPQPINPSLQINFNDRNNNLQIGELTQNGRTFYIVPITFSHAVEDLDLQIRRINALNALGHLAMYRQADNQFFFNQKMVKEIEGVSGTDQVKILFDSGNQQDEIDSTKITFLDDASYQKTLGLAVNLISLEAEILSKSKGALKPHSKNSAKRKPEASKPKAANAKTTTNTSSSSKKSRHQSPELLPYVKKTLSAIAAKAAKRYREAVKKEHEKAEKQWEQYEVRKEVAKSDDAARELQQSLLKKLL